VKLFTARYADFDPAWGTAVRTSVGTPRGWQYGPLEHVRRITPYGIRHVTDHNEFSRLYSERLERAGADAIYDRLQRISDTHGGRSLVLCCFEDLRKPGAFCHRTLLRRWLEAQLDVEVHELTRQPPLFGRHSPARSL
jgi:hypothetical protein